MKLNFILFFAFVLLGSSCQLFQSSPSIPWDQKRVLILGNSITQQGTYVSVLEYALRKKYPAGAFDIISIGLGSETVSCLTEPDHPFPRPCLKERLSRALEKVKPDIILACYGMNDGIYHPFDESRMKAFQQGVHDLAKAAKNINAPLTIITPPPFDSLPISAKLVDENAPEFGYKTPYRSYDQVLGSFSDWLINQSGYSVIDLHKAFNAQLIENRKTQVNFTFANDGVHPSPEGHLLMAQIIANGLDNELSSVLRLSPNEVFNDPFFQTIDERRRTISEGWLPFVGYTRGKVVANNSLKAMEEKLVVIDKKITSFSIPVN